MKICEKLLSKQSIEFLETYKVHNEKLFGLHTFLTNDALLLVSETARDCFVEMSKAAAALLDDSKAFAFLLHNQSYCIVIFGRLSIFCNFVCKDGDLNLRLHVIALPASVTMS